MVWLQSSKIDLASACGNIFSKANFSLVQIQKHLSLFLLAFGHTNYPPTIDYVDTGLCFFMSLSPPSRDRFLGAPHLLSRQRTTSLVRRVRGPALMSARLYPHRCWGSAPSPRRSPASRGPRRDGYEWYVGSLNSFLKNHSCPTKWPSTFIIVVFPQLTTVFSKPTAQPNTPLICFYYLCCNLCKYWT